MYKYIEKRLKYSFVVYNIHGFLYVLEKGEKYFIKDGENIG
jgi:hypothetical protein